MALIYMESTLKRAHDVLSIMRPMIDKDLPSAFDITVGGFRSGATTGLSFIGHAGMRQCIVFGEPLALGVTVVIGEPSDFSKVDGSANAKSTRYSFNYDQHEQAARFTLDWLCKGEVNYPTVSHRTGSQAMPKHRQHKQAFDPAAVAGDAARAGDERFAKMVGERDRNRGTADQGGLDSPNGQDKP